MRLAAHRLGVAPADNRAASEAVIAQHGGET
jgi:hypothetical protein